MGGAVTLRCAWGLVCVVGCGGAPGAIANDGDDDSTGGGAAPTTAAGTTAVGTTGGDEGPSAGELLCMSSLDSAIYDSPAWSPAPIEGTTECPAVDGPVSVALSTVPVGGRISFAGASAQIWLSGRGDEGELKLQPAGNGKFSTRVVPGRYDVIARMHSGLFQRDIVVIDDVAIDGPTSLQVDVPDRVEIRGIMTIDGELAGDPYGHVLIRPSDSEQAVPDHSGVLARMDSGLYSVVVPPGSYEFLYLWCDPAEVYATAAPDTVASRDSTAPRPAMSELTAPVEPDTKVPPPSPCWDPSLPAFTGMPTSPTQQAVPIRSDVVVSSDVQIDLDVRTVRLSGSITSEGVDPDEVHPILVTEHGRSGIAGSTFDARVVAGTYTLFGHSQAPPLYDSIVIDRDLHLESSLSAYPLELPLADDPSVLDVVAAGAGGGLEALATPNDAAFYIQRQSLPLDEPILVFDGGPYSVAHEQGFCWPDYEGKGFSGWKTVDENVMFTGRAEYTVALDPVARVAIEYEDLAGPDVAGFGLFGTEEDLPASAVFHAEGAAFEAHGIWPIGKYRIKDDVVDIVDGTTIHIVEESKPLQVELTIDGAPVSADDHVQVLPADENLELVHSVVGRPHWHEQGDRLPPGRYRLLYYPGGDPELPPNHKVDLGCVTIEG